MYYWAGVWTAFDRLRLTCYTYRAYGQRTLLSFSMALLRGICHFLKEITLILCDEHDICHLMPP
jgi:hypothetical protein